MNYESIGRYHVAVSEAKELIRQRNSVMMRASLVLKNASDLPPPAHGIAKRCNFLALHSLLEEAQALDAELEKRLEEIATLAPLADQPALTMA